MSERKTVIKNADMSEEMQQDSIECATQDMEKFNIEKTSQPTSKRNLIGNTIQLGIAL